MDLYFLDNTKVKYRKKDFGFKENGSVFLSEKGRATFLELWIEKENIWKLNIHILRKGEEKYTLCSSPIISKSYSWEFESYPPFMV